MSGSELRSGVGGGTALGPIGGALKQNGLWFARVPRPFQQI